jgi:hypothetical protein
VLSTKQLKVQIIGFYRTLAQELGRIPNKNNLNTINSIPEVGDLLDKLKS